MSADTDAARWRVTVLVSTMWQTASMIVGHTTQHSAVGETWLESDAGRLICWIGKGQRVMLS